MKIYLRTGLARFVVAAKQTINYRIVFEDTLKMKCWCTAPLKPQMIIYHDYMRMTNVWNRVKMCD